MTRFARGNSATKKTPQNPTPWHKMMKDFKNEGNDEEVAKTPTSQKRKPNDAESKTEPKREPKTKVAKLNVSMDAEGNSSQKVEGMTKKSAQTPKKTTTNKTQEMVVDKVTAALINSTVSRNKDADKSMVLSKKIMPKGKASSDIIIKKAVPSDDADDDEDNDESNGDEDGDDDESNGDKDDDDESNDDEEDDDESNGDEEEDDDESNGDEDDDDESNGDDSDDIECESGDVDSKTVDVDEEENVPTVTKTKARPKGGSVTPEQKKKKNQKNLAKGLPANDTPDKKKNKEHFIRCFSCLETGHKLTDCPSGTQQMMCYKCGSSDHFAAKCKQKSSDSMPFAKCFCCQKMGHIARNCPEKKNAVLRNGGKCSHCKSNQHLKSECPELKKGKGNAVVAKRSLNNTSADHQEEDGPSKAKMSKPATSKTVKF